ncbi:MAG: CBS domain-containing protein [Nitrospirota bacterium]
MLKAKDIMNTGVITVSPDTTVEELGRLLIKNGISGVPVLDGNKLFGIVTENDLIKQNKRLHIPTLLRLFDAMIPIEGFGSVEEEIKRMSASRVSEICTKKVITVNPETSLEDIATIMSEKGVHLIPVMSSGNLVGIIGKMDVIKGVLNEADKQQPS